VVDAYLSPILRRYVDQVAAQMPGVRLFFMQSSGGLTEAHHFQGKDAILSGPAGGIVGMVRTAVAAGPSASSASTWAAPAPTSATTRRVRARLRDAGGRRAHARADDEHPHRGRRRRLDPALRRRAAARRPRQRRRQPGPGLLPPRRAAGGDRCQRAARASIQPAHFPRVFGPRPTSRWTATAWRRSSTRWPPRCAPPPAARRRPESLAEGFLRIAVQNMANAIKRISVARGYDVTRYTLQCFGGAGGQHACGWPTRWA
jgi:5-oxoprolinase (ATP-hydrolysing)